MDLFQFSYLTIFAVSAVFFIELCVAIATLLSSRARTYVYSFSYTTYLYGIGALALASTIGALIYQLVYLTPVCELCWWQRIFMFPLIAIIGVALYTKERTAHITTGVLATAGLMYATYHYYYHFQGLVLERTLSLPCSSFGLLPSCTDSAILLFGFVTIPLMAVLSFGAILIFVYFAYRVR